MMSDQELESLQLYVTAHIPDLGRIVAITAVYETEQSPAYEVELVAVFERTGERVSAGVVSGSVRLLKTPGCSRDDLVQIAIEKLQSDIDHRLDELLKSVPAAAVRHLRYDLEKKDLGALRRMAALESSTATLRKLAEAVHSPALRRLAEEAMHNLQKITIADYPADYCPRMAGGA